MLALIIGQTGAGKTTYGLRLEKQKNGLLFSIDTWMVNLFWQDMPQKPSIEWFQENQQWYLQRIERCEAFIRQQITHLAQSSTPCILDLGFTSSSHRKKYLELGQELNQKIEIHYLNYTPEIRWERVQTRNSQKGESFSMNVSREMFDYMESIFEPLNQYEKQFLTTTIS